MRERLALGTPGAQALENTMKSGNHKIVIKASAREIIKKRAIDALLAEIYKQGGTTNCHISNAVEWAVDTLLREFRMVRR